MLLLAHATMADRVNAATIDHGLRAEASAEADFVASLCQSINIQHQILRPKSPITGSVQAEARNIRYALLDHHAAAEGCQWIATAHHADDQLETLLMRIARGSGVDGLAAVRESQGNIIRPLLHFEKPDLEAVCADCGVTPVQDPSNQDNRFDRVGIRQWLASSEHPLAPLRAVRTAQACADASEALDWMVAGLFKTHVRHDGGAMTLDPINLPREILRRLCLRILETIQPGLVPRGEALDTVIQALHNGEQRMLGNILCIGRETWRFQPAPARQS